MNPITTPKIRLINENPKIIINISIYKHTTEKKPTIQSLRILKCPRINV